jgi:hypothetical protein
MDTKLLTAKEYRKLSPRSQGYATYMQAALDGSEVPKECPYPEGSSAAAEFHRGEMDAVLEVQDDS